VAIQDAIDSTIKNLGTKVFFPAGSYRITQSLQASYLENTTGSVLNTVTSSTNPTTPLSQTYINSLTLAGPLNSSRRTDADLRGAEIVCDYDGGAFVGIQSNAVYSLSIENINGRATHSTDDTYYTSGGRFVDLMSGASQFLALGSGLSGFEVGLYLGGNGPDQNAEQVSILGSFWNVTVGVENTQANSYMVNLFNSVIQCREGIRNRVSSGGTTLSPQVTVFGGNIQLKPDRGGTIVKAVVSSLSSRTITFTGTYTKKTAAGDSFSSGAITDIGTDMIMVAAKNAGNIGSTRVDKQHAVAGRIASINAGADEVTINGEDFVASTALAGSDYLSGDVYFTDICAAANGGSVHFVGTHLEATNANMNDWAAMILYSEDFRGTTVFDNCEVNLEPDEGDFNISIPTVLINNTLAGGRQKNNVTIRGGRWNVNTPKFQVGQNCYLKIEGNPQFRCWPTFLDWRGRHPVDSQFQGAWTAALSFPGVAGGVVGDNDRAKWDRKVLDIPHTYDDDQGVLTPLYPRRSVDAPTKGVSGEFVVGVTSSQLLGWVLERDQTGYYSNSTITATGTTDLATVANRVEVTNTIDLYEGRLITVSGAGAASADLTTRIIATFSSGTDGSETYYIYLADDIQTDVTGAAITGVSVDRIDVHARRELVEDTTVSSAGSSSIAIGGTDNLNRRFQFDAGAGAYTYNIDLQEAGAVEGQMIRLYISKAASANPTIVVRTDDGASPVNLISINNANLENYDCEFRFNGTAWEKWRATLNDL
jgi:hypothetical protein